MTRVTIKVDAVADAYGPEEAARLLGKGEATIWGGGFAGEKSLPSGLVGPRSSLRGK